MYIHIHIHSIFQVFALMVTVLVTVVDGKLILASTLAGPSEATQSLRPRFDECDVQCAVSGSVNQ